MRAHFLSARSISGDSVAPRRPWLFSFRRRARIYCHFARDAICDGWCAVVKIGTALQTGDFATKPLPSKEVLFHSKTVLGIAEVT
jgi:hypothetical protein